MADGCNGGFGSAFTSVQCTFSQLVDSDMGHPLWSRELNDDPLASVAVNFRSETHPSRCFIHLGGVPNHFRKSTRSVWQWTQPSSECCCIEEMFFPLMSLSDADRFVTSSGALRVKAVTGLNKWGCSARG